jgi:hypothetical protein
MLCSLLNIVKGYFIVSGLFGNYYVGPNNRTVAVSTVYETNRVTICNDLQYMKCFTGTDSSNKISVVDNIYKFKNFWHFKTLINQLVLLNIIAFRLFEG